MTVGATLFGRTGRSTALSFAVFALVVLELAVTAVALVASGTGVASAVDSFAVTNAAIGLACGVAGLLISWQRPRNPVGWLLASAGVLQTASAATGALVVLGGVEDWSPVLLRSLTTVYAFAWPCSIAVCLPAALLLFPDGRLPGPRWRAVVVLLGVQAPLFVLEFGSDPAGLATTAGTVLPWLVLRVHAELAVLWSVGQILFLAVLVIVAASLVVRYRRGDEQRRRQLLWLVLALLLTIVVLVPWALLEAGPVLQLLAIALIPTAVTVAVLRHQLLDIRLVLSRTVLYVVLTAGVVGAYLGLVAVAGVLLGDDPLGRSVAATLVIAVGFNPVRVRLQRGVDRALYGDRADPVRALSRMGERLTTGGTADGDAGVDDVLGAVCEALRLPFAAVWQAGTERGRHGTAPDVVETVPLVYRGEEVGELLVGVRRGQARLDRADRSALAPLAAILAVAVHATVLSETVQRSRSEIVAAREEERRRLRRDLHDGLGPALTGISLQADAAGNLILADPDRASALLASLRTAATTAIDDVRRLVHALRPPALDELGLVGALRRHTEQIGSGPPAVTVTAPENMPTLSAAVEAAAYRIATEAVTNAVRHAGATAVMVHVRVEDGLRLDVVDDGASIDGAGGGWTPGVGLTSIHERAAELGGDVQAGPGERGWRVAVRLPL